MKIIHTADWHLGQTFFEYDRKGEHTLFLTWLREQVKVHEVDGLFIAGDLFDIPNLSAELQRQYYTFFKEVTAKNFALQIIIIAGNHDSEAQLEVLNSLLVSMDVTVWGIVKRTEEGNIDFDHLIVPLGKREYCLVVPYLRQEDYPESDAYAEGVQVMYRELFDTLPMPDKSKLFIVMWYLQAMCSKILEKNRAERTIIGRLECFSPEVFDEEIAYTALGHLHCTQRVSRHENVRYAGAPLPMLFAEKITKKVY